MRTIAFIVLMLLCAEAFSFQSPYSLRRNLIRDSVIALDTSFIANKIFGSFGIGLAGGAVGCLVGIRSLDFDIDLSGSSSSQNSNSVPYTMYPSIGFGIGSFLGVLIVGGNHNQLAPPFCSALGAAVGCSLGILSGRLFEKGSSQEALFGAFSVISLSTAGSVFGFELDRKIKAFLTR
jgi:hypothetical protein